MLVIAKDGDPIEWEKKQNWVLFVYNLIGFCLCDIFFLRKPETDGMEKWPRPNNVYGSVPQLTIGRHVIITITWCKMEASWGPQSFVMPFST